MDKIFSHNNYIIKALGNCSEHTELIITWCEEAWGYLRKDQPNYTRDLIMTRLSPKNLPIAFVVFNPKLSKNPIGTFTLTHNMIGLGDPNLTMLNNLYVDKSYRGQGIAKTILNLAENIAVNDFNINTLQIGIVDLGLKSFYEKLGWILTEETSLSHNTAFIFIKNIKKYSFL